MFSSVIPSFHTTLLPHQASASIFTQQKTRPSLRFYPPASLNNSPVPLERLSAVWVSGPYQMRWERGVCKTQWDVKASVHQHQHQILTLRGQRKTMRSPWRGGCSSALLTWYAHLILKLVLSRDTGTHNFCSVSFSSTFFSFPKGLLDFVLTDITMCFFSV